jgi:D-alanyl-D-alanine dipeptidase
MGNAAQKRENLRMWLLFLLAADLRAPPAGFVDVGSIARLHIGYATSDNFTGAPLPGYAAAGAWLLTPAAEALAKVQRDLQKEGLGLLVFDAYRPRRASLAMYNWAKRLGKTELFNQGYIALHSGHNHGNTIDLTLTNKNGAPLDMGTPWDTLDARANTENAAGVALQNRHRLQRAMKARGFVPYAKEWWHFSFPIDGTEPRDVPYGANESPEGKPE